MGLGRTDQLPDQVGGLDTRTRTPRAGCPILPEINGQYIAFHLPRAVPNVSKMCHGGDIFGRMAMAWCEPETGRVECREARRLVGIGWIEVKAGCAG